MRLGAIALSLNLLLAGTTSAQTSSAQHTEPFVCEKMGLTFSVVSLTRKGSDLELLTQVVNGANEIYKLSGNVTLVDNTGEAWKGKAQIFYGPPYHPGMTQRHRLLFSRLVGGADATSANMAVNIVVGGHGRAKFFGRCQWQVNAIPIS